MIYSKSSGQVFCFVCKLCSDNHSKFSEGFSDWKHGEQSAKEHENNINHRAASFTWSQRKNRKQRIDKELLIQFEKERLYWHSVLTRCVAAIKFLSERGLAFKGDNQTLGSVHNGNYLGVLELISQFDPFMREHLDKYGNKGKGNPSYLSANVCDELIHIMAKKVTDEIIAEVKVSKYYSISVDSTPDLSHIDQLTFILRYVTREGSPVERFVKFIEIHGHGAEYLASTVLDTLRDNEISIMDCRGQTYDNASNMAGKYTGLQQRIKDINPLAEFIPCAGHSLNLVGSCAAESCIWAITFFGFLQQLYNFFSASTYRWKVLIDHLPRNVPVTKILSNTRWSERADATAAVAKGFKFIQSALLSLQ